MARRATLCAVLGLASLLLAGCGGAGNALQIPRLSFSNGGTSSVSPQFAALEGGIPQGRQAVFIGDVVVLRGGRFRPNMKFFLGLNVPQARAPNSIFTTPRHLLPNKPFVYVDESGRRTVLEVEAPVEYTSDGEIRVTIPVGVACHAGFTNPILRMYGQDGSSLPVTDALHVVGPRCIALTPSRGVDIGGYDVVVHGDFFSRYTQVAIRFRDPTTNQIRVIGNTASSDIAELFVDRHTLVIPNWPGVVPNSTLGLSEELKADLLLFENIDSIAGSIALEPDLDGIAPCDALRAEPSPIAGISPNGVRNSERAAKFTFLPTGVTDFPSIAGIVPESGPEIGGNTVVIHGDQFDAFTADISNPANPGIGIECPPDSGLYIPPLSAVLVDRQTLVIKMPPCPVDIPEKVNFCLRNKYSIDRPGQSKDGTPPAGPTNDCIVFEDIYTYIPIPPILPPIVTAIFPATEDGTKGCAHDYGLERLFVVGDWFDGDTTLNGGFEFLLPNPAGGNPIPVQTVRTILHNRNLLEVFTARLPSRPDAPFYPLADDLVAGVRARNSVGHADFPDIMLFKATPDNPAELVLSSIFENRGPTAGGNDVLLFGDGFDTSTQVFFGAIEATSVQYVSGSLLIAKAPPGSAGDVGVTVVDSGEVGGPVTYTYVAGYKSCPALALLDPNTGTSTGGYNILAYGANLTPTSRVEFGVGSGNFSFDIFFVGSNLLRVVVPEALAEQVGIPIPVGANDPLGGCPDVLRTVDFTYTLPPDGIPEILFVETTVEVPITPTDLPALNVVGGDRMLVIGRNFDQATTFDIEKPQGSDNTALATQVRVLTANIAIMFAPESPDGLPGVADLQAHNAFGDSNEFAVEYVQPGPPLILDVRNLDDGTTTAPIDANDRIIIFGDNFFAPLTVTLTGCDLQNQAVTRTLTFTDEDVTIVEDHLIGVNIPPNVFCEGPLDITVTTDWGTASFDNEQGDPIFLLVGPQPPIVTGVFPSKFNSGGGEEAIFIGRFFTPSTEFSVRTDAMAPGTFTKVLATRIASETLAIVTMPALPGGMPPAGEPGDVRAEELNPTLRAKIAGDKFTVAEDLFRVCNDEGSMLLGVYPDHGFIDGGEQVLLFGAHFLTATGESNVTDIRFFDPALGIDIGDYVEALPSELPLSSLDPADKGKFTVLNDHTILLITHAHPPITPETATAPMTVIVESTAGSSQLVGGYVYLNTPAVLTPFLLGITPNETRLNGGSSHLLSGGFLTEADRIVFTRPSDNVTFTIPSTGFAQVTDTFLVFLMPNLSGTFVAGNVLDVHAEKDVGGLTLKSNTLMAALRVTFAGPPTITPTLSPSLGSAFGGTVVEIKGSFFTRNSQVLFGTVPARTVVFASPTRLLAIAPTLPLFAPAPGVDLTTLSPPDKLTVDVAVFTQGGWAVLADGYTFEPTPPRVDSCSPDKVPESGAIRVTVLGDFFIPGTTTATPLAGGGTVTNLVVKDNYRKLTFDYAAPALAAGASPFVDKITIKTNQGTAAKTCDITVLPDPEFATTDACVTTYTPSPTASPTTGVFEAKFVVVTLKGRNFEAGGSLFVRPRTAPTPRALTEISSAAAFTAQGQFKVVDAMTIKFTPYNVFSSLVPTLLEGNANVGPATITYRNSYGREASLADCFHYVPVFADFTDFGYPIPPTILPTWTTADKLTTGDINADGVPDVAVLPRQFTDDSRDDEAIIYIADTFGDVDIDGDGKKPDFAGTFTRYVLENDNIRTDLYKDGRGSKIRLANLDDDPQLEIIVPGSISGGFTTNHARVLLIDVSVNASGAVVFGAQTVLTPSVAKSEAVAGIAVGNFDSSHSGPDIAIITGGDDADQHHIVVWKSTGTAYNAFSDTVTAVDAAFDELVVGFLEAGDMDDDGDDDLTWAHDRDPSGALSQDKLPLVVAEVNAAAGTIVSQKAVTNLTGGNCWGIAVFDADGDDKADAHYLIIRAANGSFFGGLHNFPGVAVVLDPLGLTANAYHETGFLNDGNAIAHGDFTADGVKDLVVNGSRGEFGLFIGNGKGGYTPSGRSWNLRTDPDPSVSISHGIAAADMNRDGLDEVFHGDNGANPKAVILWLNQGR